ncbi:MAG: L-Ala-D/L-Glu epimerase [bacterium]|nr:L-Ala-D/L-Glu epimerase [bacterium]
MSRIKDIRFILKKYTYKRPFCIAYGFVTETENIEIEVITESGIVGYGESAPSFRINGETPEMILALESKVKDMILDKEIRHYREIFNITDKLLSSPSLKAGVQFAVIDALCKECEIDAWEFFGGVKNEIETDRTVSVRSIEDRIEEAIEIYKEGFRIIKIKVGEDLNKDLEAVYEICRNTEGCRYIVDANENYTLKDAVYFVKKLYSNGIDISVFEQPVSRYDIEGLKYVRFNSPFPICADESLKTKYNALKLIKEEAVDMFNIKLMKSGISDAIAIVELAKTANIKLMIGCVSESSIGINQSVQFACGIGCFDFCDLDSHLMLEESDFRGSFRQVGSKILVG